MKQDQFIIKLREIIREEVEMAVGSVMREILTEQRTKKQSAPVKQQPAPTKKVPQKKQYVKNQMLNDILNETVGFGQMNYDIDEEIPTPRQRISPVTNGTAPQRKQIVQERIETPTVVQDIAGKPVSVDSLPEELTTALTRDYSDLMKAMFKKK